MALRNIGPLPYLPVVDKKGNLKHLDYARNAGLTLLEIHRGKAKLNAEGRARGYVELEALYQDDDRPAIRDGGYKIYRDWCHAVKLGKAPRTYVEGPAGRRQCTAPFPDKFFPQELIRRRNGTSEASESTWAPPAIEVAELDESGEVVADKPKKGKAKSVSA